MISIILVLDWGTMAENEFGSTEVVSHGYIENMLPYVPCYDHLEDCR
jgi:hypothetical protein